MDVKPLRLGFVGAGRVATSLAIGLAARGYRVAAVASASGASARALAARLPECRVLDSAQAVVDAVDLVFLAVPDDVIAPLAARLAWPPRAAVVHCSGSLERAALEPAARAGAATGVFHPLQALVGGEQGARSLERVAFALEGDEPLLARLEALARALGGRPVRLPPGSKVLYHASAALASNYLVTLAHEAAGLWSTFGVSRDDALAMLLPLLRGTLDNLERSGLPRALTGPIARGDLGTVRRHLEALRVAAPDLLATYCQLGLHTVPLALARGGISEDRAQELRQLLAPGAGADTRPTGEETRCA